MDKKIERIDHYLRNVALPEPAPGRHRHELRRQVLKEIERRRTMSRNTKIWRYAAATALIGAGVVAAAVGVRYHFVGVDEKGRYQVGSEDGRRTWIFSPNTASSPEQAVQTAEEMDKVMQGGQKELISVREIEVNGRLDSRLLMYKYTLADGRTIKQPEHDPGTGTGTLSDSQMREARRLWHAALGGMGIEVKPDGARHRVTAEGKEVPTYKRVVEGRTFSFEKVPLVLSDGTEVAWSMGEPETD